MSNPSVTFHVPHDYPPILLEMFSEDILAQVPSDTIAEIKHFIQEVDDIKDRLNDIKQMRLPFPNKDS